MQRANGPERGGGGARAAASSSKLHRHESSEGDREKGHRHAAAERGGGLRRPLPRGRASSSLRFVDIDKFDNNNSNEKSTGAKSRMLSDLK